MALAFHKARLASPKASVVKCSAEASLLPPSLTSPRPASLLSASNSPSSIAESPSMPPSRRSLASEGRRLSKGSSYIGEADAESAMMSARPSGSIAVLDSNGLLAGRAGAFSSTRSLRSVGTTSPNPSSIMTGTTGSSTTTTSGTTGATTTGTTTTTGFSTGGLTMAAS